MLLWLGRSSRTQPKTNEPERQHLAAFFRELQSGPQLFEIMNTDVGGFQRWILREWRRCSSLCVRAKPGVHLQSKPSGWHFSSHFFCQYFVKGLVHSKSIFLSRLRSSTGPEGCEIQATSQAPAPRSQYRRGNQHGFRIRLQFNQVCGQTARWGRQRNPSVDAAHAPNGGAGDGTRQE